MRLRTMIYCAALLAWATAAHGASALPADYQRNAVVVKLQPETFVGRIPQPDGTVRTGFAAIDRLNEAHRCVEFKRAFPFVKKPPYGRDLVGLSDWYYIEFESDVNVAAVLEEYGSIQQVIKAEPIGIHQCHQDFPDDPEFAEQWYLYQEGNEYHIHAPSGWEFETGDSTAVIGVVDTGVLWEHPDLHGAIWVNPGEDLDSDGRIWDADDLNEVDDDGNGLIDDVIGWDFVAGGGSAWPGEDYLEADNDPRDFNGHGTHVAGIAAAVRNNYIGVAGIAGGDTRYGARIMPLRIGWSANDGGVERGWGSMYYMAQAFAYATEKGAAVINLSFGNSNSSGFGDAVANALANGVVIVQSAGNDNDDIPDYLGTIPEVISVAATKINDSRAGYSDYGSWITVSAPGGASSCPCIYSTYSFHDPDGSNAYTPGYVEISGTSMASPVVGGLALLVKSHHPEYDRDEIFQLIVDNADDIDYKNPGYEGLLGSGRVNVYNTLSGLTSANFTVDTNWGHYPLTVTFTDASPNVTDGWMYSFGDGDSAAGPNAVHTYQEAGLYDVLYRGNGPSGWQTRRKYEHIIVLKDTLKFINTEIYQDSTGALPVYLANTLPVDTIVVPLIKGPWLGSGAQIIYDDSITFGERTAYFERKQVVYTWGGGGQLAFRLVADNGGGSPPLAPGSGIIAYVWFHTKATTPAGYEEVCDSGQTGSYNLLMKTDYIDFKPQFAAGTITVFRPFWGDTNNDGEVNPLDVTIMQQYVYFQNDMRVQEPRCPYEAGDVNCDGAVNPQDMTFYVQYVFFTNDMFCPDPCWP